jgi:hypothetical protein
MRAFLRTSLSAVGVVLASVGASSDALAVDVYKCKDAHGKFNYTDSPCVGRSQMVSYSKITERNYQYKQEQAAQVKRFKAERVATMRRNSALRSNVNVFSVNEKYKNQVFDERFNHPRTSEQGVLNKNLDKIEKKRQRELKGM